MRIEGWLEPCFKDRERLDLAPLFSPSRAARIEHETFLRLDKEKKDISSKIYMMESRNRVWKVGNACQLWYWWKMPLILILVERDQVWRSFNQFGKGYRPGKCKVGKWKSLLSRASMYIVNVIKDISLYYLLLL